jgi:hypothetical protein
MSGAAFLLLLLPACGGGGGGGGGGNPAGGTPPAPQPTATPTPATGGAKPTLVITTADPKAAKSPLNAAFDLCASTDAGGGKNLTYLADFDGQGFAPQSSCTFSHRYLSGGVTVFETRLAVRGADGTMSDPQTVLFKTYVDVKVDVAPTSCNKIAATADLGAASGGSVRATAEVDRVRFEAFDAAGRFITEKDGQKQNSTRWTSGDWNTSYNNKLRVRATVFALGVEGNDTPEMNRPGCN